MKVVECYKIFEITEFGEQYNVNTRWPITGSQIDDQCPTELIDWYVYPRGTYNDNDLDVIIVRLVNTLDENLVIEYIAPGYVREGIPDGILPVHLVLRADNVNPIEGGQRAVLNGWETWDDNYEPLAIARLCNKVILHDYIPPATPAC